MSARRTRQSEFSHLLVQRLSLRRIACLAMAQIFLFWLMRGSSGRDFGLFITGESPIHRHPAAGTRLPTTGCSVGVSLVICWAKRRVAQIIGWYEYPYAHHQIIRVYYNTCECRVGIIPSLQRLLGQPFLLNRERSRAWTPTVAPARAPLYVPLCLERPEAGPDLGLYQDGYAEIGGGRLLEHSFHLGGKFGRPLRRALCQYLVVNLQ